MDEPTRRPQDRRVERMVAYERASVERFFAAACERRAALLREIAVARRRIADAHAALEAERDVETRIISLVLDVNRQLNDVARDSKKTIAATLSDAAAEAERITVDAEQRVADLSRRWARHEEPAARPPLTAAHHERRHPIPPAAPRRLTPDWAARS